jgi:hypothetical protein
VEKARTGLTFIIDGHNLIPYIPGLQLKDLDDENVLIQQLLFFHKVKQRAIEVFFDGAPAGHSGRRKVGTIIVHNIRVGSTADDAILAHLKHLQKAARNVTVVSSDHRVQMGAKSYHASIMEASTFARELQDVLNNLRNDPTIDHSLDEKDIEYWLKQFRNNEKLS